MLYILARVRIQHAACQRPRSKLDISEVRSARDPMSFELLEARRVTPSHYAYRTLTNGGTVVETNNRTTNAPHPTWSLRASSRGDQRLQVVDGRSDHQIIIVRLRGKP